MYISMICYTVFFISQTPLPFFTFRYTISLGVTSVRPSSLQCACNRKCIFIRNPAKNPCGTAEFDKNFPINNLIKSAASPICQMEWQPKFPIKMRTILSRSIFSAYPHRLWCTLKNSAWNTADYLEELRQQSPFVCALYQHGRKFELSPAENVSAIAI